MAFDCGIQMIPDRRVFNQSDPPEMIPNHCPSNLSPEQQAQLDTFKFETIKSDYQYLCDHPELHDIVGYILQRTFLEQPVQIKKFLFNLFKQSDIKEKLHNYRRDKTSSCYGTNQSNIEIVRDLGYQIVEGPNATPCGTPGTKKTVCDDRGLSPNVINRMRDRYDWREMMLPDDKDLMSSCPDYEDRTKTMYTKMTGAPHDSYPYGGDYIFLRNTRCGRAITPFIGDTNHISTRPWPYETLYRSPGPSYYQLQEEALRELSGEGESEEEILAERMGEHEIGQQDGMSVPSGLTLREYYRDFGKLAID